LVGQKTGAAAGSKTPSEKPSGTYFFAFQYRLEFKKKKADALFCGAPAFLALICTVRDEPET
jgi:hypothetical protein